VRKEDARWEVYRGLRALWWGYMRELLGVKVRGEGEGGDRGAFVEARTVGPMVASADFHGAEVKVVRARCVDRVGIRGVVVRDTKFCFEVVTRKDEVKSGFGRLWINEIDG
jgi:ribonuclease P protein subunit POP4